MHLSLIFDYLILQSEILVSWAYRSVSKVHDEWFADEENVRKAVGLLENPVEMQNAREVSQTHDDYLSFYGFTYGLRDGIFLVLG